MLTTVFDSFGYCRIGRLVAALNPINRIRRLTTSASTGRLIKISVQTIAQLRRLVARQICRDRRGGVGRDGDRRARLQLELADRDHAIAGLYAADDFSPALNAATGPHEGANGGQAGLAVIRLLLGEEKNRIAVERVIHRGFRN